MAVCKIEAGDSQGPGEGHVADMIILCHFCSRKVSEKPHGDCGWCRGGSPWGRWVRHSVNSISKLSMVLRIKIRLPVYTCDKSEYVLCQCVDYAVAILSQSSLLLQHCCNWGAWNLSTVSSMYSTMQLNGVCFLSHHTMSYMINAVYILSCVVQHQVCTLHGRSMEYFQSDLLYNVDHVWINAVYILSCVALQCPALSAPSLSIDFYTVFIQLWQFLHYCSMYTIVMCTCLKCSTSLIPRSLVDRSGYETRRSQTWMQSFL